MRKITGPLPGYRIKETAADLDAENGQRPQHDGGDGISRNPKDQGRDPGSLLPPRYWHSWGL